MSRFHRPGEEKRSVIVVDDAQVDAWLAATPDSAADLLHAPRASKTLSRPGDAMR